MTKKDLIINYLDEIIPNPVCELNYEKDYELLIAIMLSAQTTDKRVNIVTRELFTKYNNLEAFAKANISDIEYIIRSLGSYRKKAIYIHNIAVKLIEEYNGIIPIERAKLEQFSGVGRKTVNVFLSELYGANEFAVDTHVKRVSKRLKIAKDIDNVLQIESKLRKFFVDKLDRRHKQMVLFGRYYCKAVKPMCDTCKLKDICTNKKD